jgi:hypothetical protein
MLKGVEITTLFACRPSKMADRIENAFEDWRYAVYGLVSANERPAFHKTSRNAVA